MDNNKKEIEQLKDKEIVDMVLELNNNQIKHITESSLIKLMVSLNVSKTLFKDEFKDIEEINPEMDIVKTYLDNLTGLVFEKDTDKLLKIREDLYLFKNILEGYLVEISYLGEMIDDYGIKVLSNNGNYENYNSKQIDDLLNMINHTLEVSKDNYHKYSFIISEIIKILPMRLVKGNYYDTLKDCLGRNFQGYNESMVDMIIDGYKKQFDSSIRDGYGLKFDYFFMEIEKLKRKEFEGLTLDELSKIVEKVMNLTKDLTDLKDYILGLGLITNLIIVLYKSENHSVVYKELLDEWKIINEFNFEDYNNKMTKKLETMESNLSSELNKYEKLSIELASRNHIKDERLDMELLKTREILAYYNDIGFSDIKYLESIQFTAASSAYIENAIDSLIEYMERSSKMHPNKERKIRMRKILSMVDLPFSNIKDFTNYIRYSLDSRIIDKKIISFKINQMIYFLNEVNKQ